MASRHLLMSAALTMCLAIASHAQENAAPKATKSAPPKDTGQTKNSAGKTAGSLGDKKTASSTQKTQTKAKTERATFGAGCFWHVEDTFEHVKGVNWAVSGYAGGSIPHPSYEMVHEGFTGHAEVVMVDFDPEVVSYEDLLNVFWKSHDPTSIDRQGPDEGPQYRSVIFYHSEEQRRAALKSYRALTELGVYRSPIVTQLAPLKAFYRAEDYHQDYYGGKPRTSTRRKAAISTVKKSRVAKGKGSPSVVKPAESKSSTTAPEPSSPSQPESSPSL